MFATSSRWFQRWFPRAERPGPRRWRRPARLSSKPSLEALEDRLAPAVFNVNSLADILNPTPGVVTLRSAIEAANATPGPNTINLTVPGTYKISLLGAAGETDNAAGEFAITGTSNLTLVNTSGGATTIDGGGLNRVFDVNPSGENTTPFTVTFVGLIITHGSAAPGDLDQGSGGGIRAEGAASIVLDGDVLTANYATADGGGISLESPGNNSIGTLTVNASVISYNHAGDAGGGIETDGTGLVTVNPGTLVTGNTCVNQGAGIWLDAGGASLVVTGAIISNNTAITMLAGGIGNAGAGNVTITACIVENNFSGGTGGGFGDAVNMGSLTISDSFFVGNTAVSNGGGIQEGSGNVTISYSTIEANTSQGDGGGLFVNGGTVAVSNSLFSDNVAVNGGGIEDQATTLTVTGCTFNANHALGTNGGNGNTPGTGGGGGGIDIENTGGTATVANSLFVGNAANNGPTAGNGGGIQQLSATLTISDSQFTANVASNLGGGVAAGGAGTTITASTFNNNEAITGGGGVAATDTLLTLTNDTFVGNATGGTGGAVFITDFGAVTLLNDTINGNTAGTAGGGVGLGSAVAQPLSFQNTIVALDSAPSGPDVFTAGATITDKGGNLIGNLSGATGFGTGTLTGNPLLGRLEDNGGPFAGTPDTGYTVQTEALLPGSPAIATGVAAGAPASDERGFGRPGGGASLPSIGAYEPQFAAGASANQVYVESLYETLLNRPADAGAAGFVTLLTEGVSPFVVTLLIENSAEYRSLQVEQLYERFLHRQASPVEVQAVVNWMASGATLEQVETALVGSAEYYQLYGGTNDLFVEALYADTLDRLPDAVSLANAASVLSEGLSRAALVASVFASPEYHTDLVESYYQPYLGRPADPAGVANFVLGLQEGVSDQAILAALLGSQEAYDSRT